MPASARRARPAVTIVPGMLVDLPEPASRPGRRLGLVLDTEDDDRLLVAPVLPVAGELLAGALPLTAADFATAVPPDAMAVIVQETLRTRVDQVRDAGWAVTPSGLGRVLRSRILADTRRFARAVHQQTQFRPGRDQVRYAGRVFDENEVAAAVDASLDFWLTLGPHGDRFQAELARYLGVRSCVFVNSGSSANLLAFAALTSPRLGERRIRPGDEVITAAAGFPTTINPILQCGCIPVLVDADPSTGNVKANQLEEAVSERTRAVMLAHTLGNPFDLDAVTDFCRRRDLWLIEDNCDSLGSLYHGRLTGTFGDLSTQSFYPPHHLTTGEGGAVNVVSDARLKGIVESLRDWGRDCWCDSGKDNTCGKRFDWQLGELPAGYDHKYIYSHVGYNLKPLDIQAAIGCEQLKRLPGFVAARRRNWQRLREGFAAFEEHFELPSAAAGAEPSWFGFMPLVRPGAPFRRQEVVAFLEQRRIQTRMLFGGNLARQPAYLHLERSDGLPALRVVGDLAGADRLMNDAFFLGVYPGLTDAHIDYIVETMREFVERA
jgi:CDP-6-deoxy-D-xylo-4-hexulose-3-dehydrase